MKAFKYTDALGAGWLQKGSVRLGTAGYYQAMEGSQRDELDCASVVSIDNVLIGKGVTNVTTDVQKFMEENFGKVSGVMNISGVMFRTDLIGRLIFCMSLSAPNLHWTNTGATHLFEFPDVEAFAGAIERTDPGLFGDRFISSVHYAPREILIRSSCNTGPSPFIKQLRYSPEKELRICWKAKRELPEGSPVDIFVPDLSNLIRPIAL